MLTIEAQFVREVSGLDLQGLMPGPSDAYLLRDRTVSLLDDHLDVVRTLPVDLPDEATLLTATSDLSLVVVAGEDSVTVLAGDRRMELDVEEAGPAILLTDGRLLITGYHDGLDGVGVNLFDLGTGRHLSGAVIGDDGYGYAMAHPKGGPPALSLGMGQHGSLTFAAHIRDDTVTVEQIAEDLFAGNFSPSGDRLLLMPQSGINATVRVVDWPSGTTLAEFDGTDEDVLDGFFLDDGRVLLNTDSFGMLLYDEDLNRLAHLALPLPGDGNEWPNLVRPLPNGRLATRGRRDATVWQVPRSSS